MKIVVAGGTGWIGSALCRALMAQDHDVLILSRSPSLSRQRSLSLRYVQWDGASLGSWAAEIDGADAVVNLSGESIANGRWNDARKKALRDSRTVPTQTIVAAIRAAQQRPSVLVNASAVGYYGDRGDQALTESDPPGDDFLARLVVAWEQGALEAEGLGVRVCLPRLGIVLGSGGGPLEKLSLPFRFFVGGSIGSGRQWMSWVHIDDVVGILMLAIENANVSGAINVTAPTPVTNREMAQTLGSVMGRPSWMPVPAFALHLALGELAGQLLMGQRVLPAVANRLGYSFRYPTLSSALRGALERVAVKQAA